MKLPSGGQNLGVQSLGRESGDSTARGKLELVNAVVGQVDAYQERKSRHQTALADARIATWDSDFRRKYDGLDHIEVADLPKAMQKEYASETRVPAFEVRARLYEEGLQEAMNDASETISDERVRGEWYIGKQAAASSKVAERYIQRDEQQIDFYKKEAISAADEAVDEGHYAVARHLIQSSELDSVEKKDRIRLIDGAEEQSMVNDTLRTGSIDDVRELHQLYASKKYDGAFDSAQALQAKNALKTRLEFLTDAEKKAEIGNKAEEFVKKAMADNTISASERQAIIDGIKDDDVRQEARRRFTAAKAAEKRAEAEELKEKQDAYLESFRDFPDPERFAAAPDIQSENEARRYYNQIVSGKKKVTDLNVYQDLRQKILDGKDVNLSLSMSKLTDTDYKELVRLQQADDDEMKSAQSLNAEINSVMIEMGMNLKSGTKITEEQNRIYYLINSELQIEAALRDKPLTWQERQAVYDRLQMEFVKEKDLWFDEEFGLEDVVKDIPTARIREIQAALRAGGYEVNAANIKAYIDNE
jgi:hypothetical protein